MFVHQSLKYRNISVRKFWRLLFFWLGGREILLKYCIYLISAAAEARPEQTAADAGGGRRTAPRIPRRSPRPPWPPWSPTRPGRPSLGLPVPGGVRGLAAGRDAAHLVLRGGPGPHDGGGQAPRAAPPRRHGRALRREGEGAGQAAGAAGIRGPECEYCDT